VPSIALGSEIQLFTNIYYVDATYGADTNSGTALAPLRSVQAAVTKCATTGDAVVAREGTYDVTTTGGSYGYGGLSDAGKSIAFIGTPGKTIFKCDGVKNNLRDHHAVCTYGAGTTIYNIIFEVNNNGRTLNHATALFGREANYVNATVYNSWFKVTGLTTKGLSIIYSNVASGAVLVYNSVFESPIEHQASYANASRATLINCAATAQLFAESIRTTCLSNVGLSVEGRIESTAFLWKDKGTGTDKNGSVADIGLFGGPYAWEVPGGMAIDLPEPEITVPKNTDVEFPYRVNPPLPAAASKQLPMTRTVAGVGHRHRSEDIEISKWHNITGVRVN
jgi:hypothetical protein